MSSPSSDMSEVKDYPGDGDEALQGDIRLCQEDGQMSRLATDAMDTAVGSAFKGKVHQATPPVHTMSKLLPIFYGAPYALLWWRTSKKLKRAQGQLEALKANCAPLKYLVFYGAS